MDTKQLVAEAKARFNHNTAKEYLREKYEAKLLVAEQGGLWRASPELLSYLALCSGEERVLIDTFGNPVKVKCTELGNKLCEVYNNVMNEWHDEWKALENKR